MCGVRTVLVRGNAGRSVRKAEERKPEPNIDERCFGDARGAGGVRASAERDFESARRGGRDDRDLKPLLAND